MNTHIWRYKDNRRNYPGYHLSADAEGCAALLEWLRSPKARPEFRLQPVTSEVLGVPNNQGGSAAYVACTLLKLLVRSDVGRGHFIFSEVSGRLSLECSPQQVECIIGGVEDIVRGRGDYCIGGDDQHVLWFWWYPHERGSNRMHTNRRPALQFQWAGFFKRWIRSQRPSPAAVGDPWRWLHSMKSSSVLLSLLVLAAGCASHSSRVSPAAAVALPPRLDSYFEDYCDYTGNLGIGFDPAHTYDYRFRQHLKRTQDPELKRLFVLQHLYRDVDIGLRDFQAGIVITGQSSSRSLTAAEWQETRRRIEEQIDDLAAYSGFTNFARVSDDPFRASDPSLDKDWIAELRGQLRGITNAPAANKTVERTGAPPLSSEHE